MLAALLSGLAAELGAVPHLEPGENDTHGPLIEASTSTNKYMGAQLPAGASEPDCWCALNSRPSCQLEAHGCDVRWPQSQCVRRTFQLVHARTHLQGESKESPADQLFAVNETEAKPLIQMRGGHLFQASRKLSAKLLSRDPTCPAFRQNLSACAASVREL